MSPTESYASAKSIPYTFHDHTAEGEWAVNLQVTVVTLTDADWPWDMYWLAPTDHGYCDGADADWPWEMNWLALTLHEYCDPDWCWLTLGNVLTCPNWPWIPWPWLMLTDFGKHIDVPQLTMNTVTLTDADWPWEMYWLALTLHEYCDPYWCWLTLVYVFTFPNSPWILCALFIFFLCFFLTMADFV